MPVDIEHEESSNPQNIYLETKDGHTVCLPSEDNALVHSRSHLIHPDEASFVLDDESSEQLSLVTGENQIRQGTEKLVELTPTELIPMSHLNNQLRQLLESAISPTSSGSIPLRLQNSDCEGEDVDLIYHIDAGYVEMDLANATAFKKSENCMEQSRPLAWMALWCLAYLRMRDKWSIHSRVDLHE